jgi:hypothetical protein
MRTTKISNVQVKPVITEEIDPSKIGGYSLIPSLYPSNIIICGPTASGKTSVIATLIDKTIGKHTNCIFFVSSIQSDPTYREIIKKLKKKGNEITKFLDIQHEDEDDDGNNGKPYDALDALRKEFQSKYPDTDSDSEADIDKEEELIESKKLNAGLNFGETEKLAEIKEKKKAKKRPKKLWPDYLFVFDDLGESCRSPSIGRFITKSRHFHTRTIFASHSLKDLMPRSTAQSQFILLMGGYNIEQIKELYDKLCFPIPFDKFWKAYQFATHERYHFLFIDRIHNQLRRDFNCLIDIESIPNEDDNESVSSRD